MKRKTRSRLWRPVLTAEEKRTIVIVCCLIILGLWTKHHRESHPMLTPPAVTTKAKPLAQRASQH